MNFVFSMSNETKDLPVEKLNSKFNNLGVNDDDNNNVSEDTDFLKVRFNGITTYLVKKEKLLLKSEYFRAITSPNFSDHYKKYLEVNFKASKASFKQIISYIDTGDIDINKENVFEIFELAKYLQVETLFKKCQSVYIYNLSVKTMVDQLSTMMKSPVFNEFLKIMLCFCEREKPSISGLYVLEFKKKINSKKNYEDELKTENFCKQLSANINRHSYKHEVIHLQHDCNEVLILPMFNKRNCKILQLFGNKLIAQSSSIENVSLFFYDPITGNK